VTVTRKQLANLQRGGASAEALRRAREAKARQAEEDQRLGRLAAEEPYEYFEALHAVMARHLLRLLRSEERERRKPDRETTARMRELRVLTEALIAYRQTRQEAEVEAEAFFATLEARITNLVELEALPRSGKALTTFES
jgi:hypothetical protein